jgi:hypothetical protein
MNRQNKKAIRERLAALDKRYGTLTPDAVVEDARDPKSPLHGEFNWDVKQAAMEHWRERARDLIRTFTVTVTYETHKIAIPEWVRNPRAKSRDQGYSRVSKIRSEKDNAMEALMREIEYAEAAIERARRVAIGLGLEQHCERLLAEIAALKKATKTKAAA